MFGFRQRSALSRSANSPSPVRAVGSSAWLAAHAMPSRLDMRETGAKSRSFLGALQVVVDSEIKVTERSPTGMDTSRT